MNETNIQSKINSLSEDQRAIYKLLVSGHTIEQIASQMDRPEGIIAAQRTRIINKGIDLPELPQVQQASQQASQQTPSTPKYDRPRVTSRSSNEAILDEAQQAGSAEYNVEKIIEEVKKQTGDNLSVRDVHPMVLLGITIQFMKLTGGRMHAHQLIEDVYGALRAMVDGGQMREVPGATTQTKPWPPEKPSNIQSADASILSVLEKMQQDQRRQSDELAMLARQLRNDE